MYYVFPVCCLFHRLKQFKPPFDQPYTTSIHADSDLGEVDFRSLCRLYPPAASSLLSVRCRETLPVSSRWFDSSLFDARLLKDATAAQKERRQLQLYVVKFREMKRSNPSSSRLPDAESNSSKSSGCSI